MITILSVIYDDGKRAGKKVSEKEIKILRNTDEFNVVTKVIQGKEAGEIFEKLAK